MSRNEQLQRIFRQYEEEHGRMASTTREACIWGVKNGLLLLQTADPYDRLADEMSRALREEYAVDAEGRRYRVNHAYRATRAGIQLTLWARLGVSEPDNVHRALMQRREQIVGDCFQLKVDVDVFNDMYPDRKPVQLILDFKDDVAEREFWKKDDAA